MSSWQAESWEEQLVAIRKRPAMYVGGTQEFGLRNLFGEILDNSVEEAVAGRVSRIDVVRHADGSFSVTDDGTGMLTATTKAGEEGLAGVLTTLSDPTTPRLARGMSLVGVAVVNALSEWFEVSTRNASASVALRFEQGNLVGAPVSSDPLESERGTRVRFRPDPTVFSVTPFAVTRLQHRVRVLSYLVPGVRFAISDEVSGLREDYWSPGGLADYLEVLTLGREPGHAAICADLQEAGMHVAAAVQFGDWEDGPILSFANHHYTWGGGVHERALLAGLVRGLNDAFPADAERRWPRFRQRHLRHGIAAIVSVRLPHVQWEGASRQDLGNAEIGKPVMTGVRRAIVQTVGQDPDRWHWLTWRLLE